MLEILWIKLDHIYYIFQFLNSPFLSVHPTKQRIHLICISLYKQLNKYVLYELKQTLFILAPLR
jgi:hypothetical protein